jgi:predicted RNA-binding protein (virulence factor B family)
VTILDELLGRRVVLRVRRLGAPGAFVSDDAAPDETILLPRRDVRDELGIGDELEVFVHLDSEDRPVATTATPKVTRDRVAFLEVRDVAPFGAFVDWGLAKDLLVPNAELLRDVRPGDRHPIGVYLDDTGRLAGTMRVSEMLHAIGEFERDEWVEGEAWRKEPGLGVFVIVEHRFVGLLPEHEPSRLSRGERARFRVSVVHPDGKIELSLRAPAHEQRDADADAILAVLSRPDAPRVSDASSPDQLRRVFGLSKKAFKRALGGLLKRGAVSLGEGGAVSVSRSVAAPASASRSGSTPRSAPTSRAGSGSTRQSRLGNRPRR